MRSFEQPVLVVDDDADSLMLTRETLKADGIGPVSTLRDGRLVSSYLAKNACDLVLLDLGLPAGDGQELISTIVTKHPKASVVILSGRDDVSTAISCVHRGAFDYLVKPCAPNQLIASARRALDRHRPQPRSVRSVLTRTASPDAFADLITISPAMHATFEYVTTISSTGQPVLITGETGTGKDLIAKALHNLSGVSGEYVAVNVGGFDDTMFADALFGHRKGAFTGAAEQRLGLVLRALGGTLFLDEIGDLSPASQVKLLRLLQDGEYFPLGSDEAKYSTARTIVATSHDVRSLQETGRFRKDLFYRLRAHHVHLLPLRERPEDIPVLIAHFATEAAAAFGRSALTLPDDLLRMMSTYAFPGNVRELRSMVYDGVSRSSGGTLLVDPFRQALADGHRFANSKLGTRFGTILPTLREMRTELIEEAMKRADGNQARAAESLGISRQALNKRLHLGPHASSGLGE